MAIIISAELTSRSLSEHLVNRGNEKNKEHPEQGNGVIALRDKVDDLLATRKKLGEALGRRQRDQAPYKSEGIQQFGNAIIVPDISSS